MAIHREIEIDAAPSATRAAWAHFLHSVRTSQHRLACDELACTDAVGTGAVQFELGRDGRTRVIVEVEPDGGPAEEVLGRQVVHDLLVFKDYVERGRGDGVVRREGPGRVHDDERHNQPARERLTGQNHNAPAGGSFTDRYPT